MKIRLRPRLLIWLHLFVLYACVETYDVSYHLDAELLTVEGFVTDEAATVISISKSKSLAGNYYSVPLTGCIVELVVGDGTIVPLKESVEGMYSAGSSFQGKVGQTYQLRFRTPEGKQYESTKELLNPVADVKKIYQELDQNGLLDKTGKRVVGSTVDIFLDFDDPKESKNYYLWRWKHYEEQPVCITCDGGRLVGGTCVKINSRNPPTYDYPCDKACWEVFYNPDILIFSDELSNGLSVRGKLIAKIPYHSSKGCLLEVEQIGITREAYLYYKLLRDQNQNTGTLTDTPPAPMIGNLRNVNDADEAVIGYFGAASSRLTRYWVNRSSYTNATVVSLLGREINLENTSPFPPPTYPCVISKSRTPIRPEGWQ